MSLTVNKWRFKGKGGKPASDVKVSYDPNLIDARLASAAKSRSQEPKRKIQRKSPKPENF